ncbi:MAG TPA: hypothetical protein VFH47_06630, partial [Candidatus Thermoplasmatota archaeon]|nr:hypothetical protein [Candidatus Thermoplasmatota archaeon]
MTARAHAPGHVSGLFAIHDEPEEPLRKGSRGAGWCVDRGATATAMPSERPRLRVDGAEGEWEVTRRALHILAPRQAMDVDVRLELPVGQGFGMSAAGTLAACLAAASELGLEPEAALEATHQAEVEAGGGLGDAVAAWHGSAEVRMRPGCPPHGWVSRVEPPPGTRLLYCVLGDPLPTRSVIREPSWKLRTRALAASGAHQRVEPSMHCPHG